MNGIYVPPTLVVDAVIFQIIDASLQVLLIQRAAEPFEGVRALPGGYDPEGETTREAFHRILLAKGGIDDAELGYVEQLYTFDTVARDPRGHAVSISYMGLARDLEPRESAMTQQPQFFDTENLPKLAYDHDEIIRYAVERLRSKISYTTAVSALLPKRFTLTQLQSAYEAILGRPLDKRNFRKKFLSFDVIKETEEFAREGAHRPARLYAFKDTAVEPLTRSFE